MANNLRKNGGSIPGIRAGKATSDYLRNACHSLAGSGAFVLSVIACVPILATAVTGLNMHFGGTSLLIVTGFTLEVIDSLNSHLILLVSVLVCAVTLSMDKADKNSLSVITGISDTMRSSAKDSTKTSAKKLVAVCTAILLVIAIIMFVVTGVGGAA